MSVVDFFLSYWDWYFVIGFYTLCLFGFVGVDSGVKLRDGSALVLIVGLSIVWTLWPVFLTYMLFIRARE